jgi:hypothetical protein
VARHTRWESRHSARYSQWCSASVAPEIIPTAKDFKLSANG